MAMGEGWEWWSWNEMLRLRSRILLRCPQTGTECCDESRSGIISERTILTRDILTEAISSSEREIVKVFVCCPIVILSPELGAKISFVMDLIVPQLSTRADDASCEAWTIICMQWFLSACYTN
jgi:hypothetical protein